MHMPTQAEINAQKKNILQEEGQELLNMFKNELGFDASQTDYLLEEMAKKEAFEKQLENNGLAIEFNNGTVISTNKNLNNHKSKNNISKSNKASLFENMDEFLLNNSPESLGINTEHKSFAEVNNIEDFINSSDFNQYRTINTESDSMINYNAKTVEDILGLTSLKHDDRKSMNSIEHYDIEIDTYNQILEQSPILQETLKEGEALLKPFKYLLQDIYLSLIKLKPRLLNASEISSSALINRQILKSLINTPEYITLRKTCQLNDFNSALGSEIIAKEALEIIKQIVDKMIENNQVDQIDKINQLADVEEEIEYLAQENDDLQEMIQQMQDMGKNTDSIQQQINNNNMQLEKAKQLANAIRRNKDNAGEYLQEQISQTTQEIIDNNTNYMIDAINNGMDTVNEASNIINEWGLGDGDVNSKLRISLNSKKMAIEKIRHSAKLTKLTDIIGKFKDTAIAEQKKKSKYGAVEIKSVTTGKRIEDVLPSDRMNLANDVTKKDFYRRMTDNQLLVYSKESSNEKNKGPIVMCIDTSGSMRGDREMWSKALAVGVIEIAQLQRRDYACISFSSKANQPIVIDRDKPNPQKIIDIAEEFSGGGTSFEEPLQKASELIKESKFKNADILFITDGDCSISSSFESKFKNLKDEKEFRCIGVLIDSYKDTEQTSLKDFCDKIISIKDIRDLDAENQINKEIFADL